MKRAGRQEGSGEECRPALNLWFATMRFRAILRFLRNCARARIRTWDPASISGVLYQLSYARIKSDIPAREGLS